MSDPDPSEFVDPIVELRKALANERARADKAEAALDESVHEEEVTRAVAEQTVAGLRKCMDERQAALTLADELAAALRGLDDNDGIDTFTDEGVLAFVKARAAIAKWEASRAE